MSKDLSQIVNELFESPSKGKDLSSQIKRLGEEIRKVLQGEDSTFGKFNGLLASFKDVIPDENQRYQAALKALSTTSKLNNKEIMKSFSGQMAELKILEKSVMPALSGWSEGLKEMEARAKDLKGEIADLRKKLAELESEEKTVQAGVASREKDLKSSERTIRELFADITKEIAVVNRKIGQLIGEPVDEEPVPEKAAGRKKKKTEEKSVEITVASAPMDPKYQRKCPMCGGLFNLHELENMWQCYTCGHEEPTTGSGPGAGGAVSEPPSETESGPVFDPSQFRGTGSIFPSDEDEGGAERTASSRDEPLQKKSCPACGRTMFYYPNEKAWRCNSCGYERRI